MGNLQIDTPLFTFFCGTNMLKGMDELGVNHHTLFAYTARHTIHVWKVVRQTFIKTADLITREIFTQTDCFFAKGGYDRVAAKLFCEVTADVH